MNDIATQYFNKFSVICSERKIKGLDLVHGASEKDLELLRERYPDIPESLLALLKLVDGTYYRKYGDKELCIPFFDGEIPYYLNSVEQILKQKGESIAYIYGEPELEALKDPKCLGNFIDDVSEAIDPFQPFSQMLHFSDCINNGGSSALYIDFNPSPKGVKGQIVRFMHDPDEYTVLDSSFDEFLQKALQSNFDFIEEEREPYQALDLTNFVERLESGEAQAVKFAKNYYEWMTKLHADPVGPDYTRYDYLGSDFDRFTDAAVENVDYMLAILKYAEKTKNSNLSSSNNKKKNNFEPNL